MKCLARNKTRFYFAQYSGKTEITDTYGNKTGEYTVTYGNPVEAFANISAAMGDVQSRQFGDSLSYDKVIVLSAETPIDEYSILWIDTMPVLVNGATSTPHDYIVRKVARSLNGVAIAVSKVKVNG